MSNCTIVRNPFAPPEEYELFTDVGDIGDFLQTEFIEWPASARIYHGEVSDETDVTPFDLATEAKLRELTGEFFVVVFPEGPLVFAIIAIVIALVAVGLSFLFRPSVNVKTNQQQQSPNNALSNRSNQARPNQRIPDIVGTVNSVPDLLSPPYREFVNSQEIEVTFNCIGVGKYAINADDVLEDQTQMGRIAGASVEVYGPNTSPNSGDDPQLRIGSPIGRKLVTAQSSNAVNGQTLNAPNINNVVGHTDIRFGPDYIESSNTSVDFTTIFTVGASIIILDGSVGGHDFSGTYVALSVTPSKIVLASPATVNAAWSTIAGGTTTAYFSPTVYNTGLNFVGWFFLAVDTQTEVWLNFVANNGMFKIDAASGNQYATSVELEATVQAIDASYAPIGAERTYTVTLEGSAAYQSTRAVTLKIVLPETGRCQIRVRRITPIDTSWNGQQVTGVQWRDCYSITPVSQLHFGNVTTVQTLTYATEGALTVSARKLNMLVTRKVFRYFAGGAVLTPAPGDEIVTTNAADIICSLALMPHIGRRVPADLNIANIYALLGPTIPAGSVTTPVSVAGNVALWSGPFASGVVDTESAAALPIGASARTICAFITSTLTTHQALFGYGTSGPGNAFDIESGITGSGVVYFVGYAADVAGTINICDGVEHHVAATFDGTTLRIYVDGVLDASGVPSLNTPSGTNFITGEQCYSDGGGNPFWSAAANIRDVRVYDRALSTGELATIIAGPTTVVTAGSDSVVGAYFGTDLCTQFCYTFDDASISFEETIADIAQAVFCTAFRKGSVLDVYFEKKTSDSVMLMNHRTKIPSTETRTYRFGNPNDSDGIELTYIEPNEPNYIKQDRSTILYFPADRSAKNPKTITAIGIRNFPQAYLFGNRLYNKLRFQWISTQFDATTEARLLLQSQRFLCADNTRDDTIDGYVTNVSVLTLTLSQPITDTGVFARSPMIALQHPNKTVELIPITAGVDEFTVVLGHAPGVAIHVDPDDEINTNYTVVCAAETRSIPFLLTDKTPQPKKVYALKAVNYDDRYYANDPDFINGVIANTTSAYAGNPYPVYGGGGGGGGVGSYLPSAFSGGWENCVNGDPSDLYTSGGRYAFGIRSYANVDVTADCDITWDTFVGGPAILTVAKTLYLTLTLRSLDGGDAMAILTYGSTVLTWTADQPTIALTIPLPIGFDMSSISLELQGAASGDIPEGAPTPWFSASIHAFFAS